MDILSSEEFNTLSEIATKNKDIDTIEQLQGWNTLMMVLKEAGKLKK